MSRIGGAMLQLGAVALLSIFASNVIAVKLDVLAVNMQLRHF